MKKLITAALMAPFALGLAACDVDQTKEGKMPEVKVTEGEMPKYDVQAADVDVGTKETTVTVPTVDVTMPDAKGKPVTGKE